MASQNVRLLVKGAKHLASKESDASVKGTICECQVEGKPETKVRTTSSENSGSPVWNQELPIQHVGLTDKLVFILCDCETVGETHKECASAGARATFPAERFLPDGFEGEVTFSGAGQDGGDATLDVSLTVLSVPSEEAPMLAADPEEASADPPEALEDGKDLSVDEKVRAAISKGLDQELVERARTRAYFLWKNGSKAGADADYFEAVKTELQTPSAGQIAGSMAGA
eukprot:TRINITY_DN73870_c0_g1_i1.p1 TRINITY_DN73870_c0_g1~~TRINITY_DN73870_c0_g1_i1.p1  ORF type:complete len:228 (-),score=54.85 TRINITY_DN73870_c0_g1_i1:152-835(-)